MKLGMWPYFSHILSEIIAQFDWSFWHFPNGHRSNILKLANNISIEFVDTSRI